MAQANAPTRRPPLAGAPKANDVSRSATVDYVISGHRDPDPKRHHGTNSQHKLNDACMDLYGQPQAVAVIPQLEGLQSAADVSPR